MGLKNVKNPLKAYSIVSGRSIFSDGSVCTINTLKYLYSKNPNKTIAHYYYVYFKCFQINFCTYLTLRNMNNQWL